MKKQTRIYDLFWVLFLLQIILTIMIWWSQGVTGASASSGRFSGGEFLLPALFKVPLRLQP